MQPCGNGHVPKGAMVLHGSVRTLKCLSAICPFHKQPLTSLSTMFILSCKTRTRKVGCGSIQPDLRMHQLEPCSRCSRCVLRSRMAVWCCARTGMRTTPVFTLQGGNQLWVS